MGQVLVFFSSIVVYIIVNLFSHPSQFLLLGDGVEVNLQRFAEVTSETMYHWFTHPLLGTGEGEPEYERIVSDSSVLHAQFAVLSVNDVYHGCLSFVLLHAGFARIIVSVFLVFVSREFTNG